MRAVRQGVTLKELVTGYIEAGLRSSEAVSGRRLPLPVAFKRVKGAAQVPSRSNAELHAILDGEDLAAHQRIASQDSSGA